MTDDMASEVVFDDIRDDVEAVAKGESGGQIELTFYYTGDGEREHLYTDTVPKQFFKKRTVRGELKNNVADTLDGLPIDPEDWAADWSAWVSEYIAAEADARPELVPESVEGLAKGTQRVEVSRRGDTTRWRVVLDWQGRTGEIVLDHNDMAKGGYSSLKAQLFKEFANSPDFAKEDWYSLKQYWIDIQEETAVESMTETDRAVESFLSEVSHRIIPHEDPDALLNGKEAAWVDWDNSHEVRTNGRDHDGIVWVRSDLISAILDSIDVQIDIGELGGELQDRGKTVRGSGKLQPKGKESKRRYWFFDAAAFGLSEMDVHSMDTGDAPGEVDA